MPPPLFPCPAVHLPGSCGVFLRGLHVCPAPAQRRILVMWKGLFCPTGTQCQVRRGEAHALPKPRTATALICRAKCCSLTTSKWRTRSCRGRCRRSSRGAKSCRTRRSFCKTECRCGSVALGVVQEPDTRQWQTAHNTFRPPPPAFTHNTSPLCPPHCPPPPPRRRPAGSVRSL